MRDGRQETADQPVLSYVLCLLSERPSPVPGLVVALAVLEEW